MSTRGRKIAAFLSLSALVMLDAGCPLYVLGDSGDCDEEALRLGLEGIDLGFDRGLTPWERNFFWLPLGHSENLALHELSVEHAEEEAANTPAHLKTMAEFGVGQAKAARDVIARFGRHPHRNEILGRTSTPEELEYLRTETPPHLRKPPSS